MLKADNRREHSSWDHSKVVVVAVAMAIGLLRAMVIAAESAELSSGGFRGPPRAWRVVYQPASLASSVAHLLGLGQQAPPAFRPWPSP